MGAIRRRAQCSPDEAFVRAISMIALWAPFAAAAGYRLMKSS
jgi:hypothetical protein